MLLKSISEEERGGFLWLETGRKIERKRKKRKKMLSRQNEFGIQDPTPFEAVSLMINKERGGKINER